MKITMKHVVGMGKIVVALMLIQHIVMIVHALIPNQILIQLQRHQQKFVALHNGKETISVMIKIIMKDVVGMVKIVVVTMLIWLIVLFVNVVIQLMERQQQGNIPPLLFVILCSYDQIILWLSQDSQGGR